MVLLGSTADPNVDQVEKLMEESAKNNVKGLAGDEDDCKGEEELLKREMEGFVNAQLVATAPRTMDKAMLQLNLKKPKVGGESK